MTKDEKPARGCASSIVDYQAFIKMGVSAHLLVRSRHRVYIPKSAELCMKHWGLYKEIHEFLPSSDEWNG